MEICLKSSWKTLSSMGTESVILWSWREMIWAYYHVIWDAMCLWYAVYGCVICEINAVSNVIQWFLSVSNTNPHGIFDMPFSKPIANWVQLSVWSYPQCTWGNYQIVIVILLVPNERIEINIVRGHKGRWALFDRTAFHFIPTNVQPLSAWCCLTWQHPCVGVPCCVLNHEKVLQAWSLSLEVLHSEWTFKWIMNIWCFELSMTS